MPYKQCPLSQDCQVETKRNCKMYALCSNYHEYARDQIMVTPEDAQRGQDNLPSGLVGLAV